MTTGDDVTRVCQMVGPGKTLALTKIMGKSIPKGTKGRGMCYSTTELPKGATGLQGKILTVEAVNNNGIMSSDAELIIDCLKGSSGELAELNNVYMNDSLFNEVIINLQDTDKALVFFNWTVSRFRHTSFTVKTMTETLARMNRHVESRKLFQLWKRKSLPALMCTYSQQGNLEAVLKLLGDVALNGNGYVLSIHDVNSCLDGLCKAGNLDDALKLVVEARRLSVKPSIHSYGILVRALRSANRTEDVYELLREVRRRSLKVDEVLHVSRMLQYVEEGDTDKALQTFHNMLEENCLASESECYSGLVRVLYQTDRLEEACEVATKAGCDSEAVNSLVNFLLGKELVEQARELIVAMAAKHGASSVKVLTFNNVLNILCRDPGSVEKAVELLKKMDNLGLEADKYTYSILITRLCKSMMVDEAKALMELMIQRGCVPDARTYNPLVEQLCKDGRVTEADELARAANTKRCTNVFTCNNMLFGFLKTRQVGRALEFLKQMLTAGPSPDVFTYNIFMKGLCRLGQWKAARRLLPSMNQEGVLPDVVTYNTLIDGIREAGKPKLALQMMREMSERDCQPNVVTLNALMKWYTRNGHVEECWKVFQSVIDRGLAPTVMTYNMVISALCKAGRLDEAHRLFGAMVTSGCSPNVITYRVIIHGLCMRKELDKAVVLLETMSRRGCEPDVTCYNSVVGELCEQGRIDEAYALLEQMPCSGDKVLFRTLVRGLCKLQLRSLSHNVCDII